MFRFLLVWISVLFCKVICQEWLTTVQNELSTVLLTSNTQTMNDVSVKVPSTSVSETNSKSIPTIGDTDLLEICASVCQLKNTSNEDVLELPTNDSRPIPLYLGAFFEGPGGGWDGSGCVPAIEMALEHINARKDILPEYELRAVWADTKVRTLTS